MSKDSGGIEGVVTWELRGPDGEIKKTGRSFNLITDAGDTCYAHRGSGQATGMPAAPTGMQLGTGTTAVAKTGAGAALVTYLDKSDHTFDSTYPTVTAASSNSGATVTYRCTYAADQATSAGAITEAVVVNKTLVANGTTGGTAGTAAQTISRVLLSGIGSKGASDTLTITWTHNLKGGA